MQNARVEKSLQLVYQITLANRLSHLQVPGRQNGRYEIVRADIDGDAVTKLGAYFKGLVVSRDVMEGDAKWRGPLVIGGRRGGADLLEKAAFEEERELHFICNKRPEIKRFH